MAFIFSNLCFRVAVPIPWPRGNCITKLPEMRAAFSEISRRAYAATTDSDSLPPEYIQQQRELDALMTLMNSEFSRLLKFYALKYAGDAIGPTEELESVRLTQLTYVGLCLEMKSLDLGNEFGSHLKRTVTDSCVIFDTPCTNPSEVEEKLIDLFMPPGDAPSGGAY